MKQQTHWDKQAKAYDAWIGEVGDPLRAEFLDPLVMDLLGNVQDKRLLDAGCGNGYFTNRLQVLGAGVIGIDSSKELIKIAKSKFKGEFQVADLTQELPFANESFELVLAHLALMDLAECDTIIAESYRVLETRGRVIVSILHPLFTPPVGKFHRGVLGRIWPTLANFRVTNYYKTGKSKKKIYQSKIESIYYHRTFASYINKFLQAGFTLQKLLEPRPSREFLATHPQYQHADKIPIFLVLEFQKN